MNRQQRQEYAERLRQAFHDSGMQVKELAAEVERRGGRARAVADFSRGAGVPQERTLLAIGDALGIYPEPEDVRASWPKDVSLFLDTLGLAVMALPEHERDGFMRDVLGGVVNRPYTARNGHSG